MSEEEKKVEETQTETVEEAKTEEVTQSTTENNKKGSNKAILIIMGIIIVVLLIVVVILLLGGNDKNKENSNTEPKQNTDNTEVEPKSDDPIIDEKVEDAEYLDLNVSNVNSKNKYEIQLAKKYDKDHEEYTDGYTYGFYNKTTKKMITDITYKNESCGQDCSVNKDAIGCLEGTAKVFSFELNNADYLYISHEINVCGGIDSSYIIYDVNKDEIIKEGTGGRGKVESVNGEIIINYRVAGEDVCGLSGVEILECYGNSGYIFSKNGAFEVIEGKGSFKYNDKYVIIDYSRERDPKKFTLNLYNEKGEKVSSIENAIAYNDKYVVTYNGNELGVYELNNNKLGVITSITYNDNKYDYRPDLEVENGKLVLTYQLKGDYSNSLKAYFELN